MSPIRINGKLATQDQLDALKKSKAEARLEKQRLARGWYYKYVPVDTDCGLLYTPSLFEEEPPVTPVLVPPPRKPREKKPPKPLLYTPPLDFSEE